MLLPIILVACSEPVNTNQNENFDDSGYLIVDSTEVSFVPKRPNKIKFYVEVSGSMNGFFRANVPTRFKTDVWQVLNYYSPISEDITVLTNDGNQGISYDLKSFQTLMNTGAFVSSASTKIPIMLQSIIQNLDTNAGQVAVLISDMKYDPIGQAAPQVLLTQFSTDVSTIFGKSNKAVSLVGATSQYLDKTGNSICDTSPYYFLIIGNGDNVAEMRNGISTLLENNGDFIDNIESGLNFSAPSYAFGIPENAYQLDNEPTFLGYDTSYGDTCTIKLKVNLANYRWALTRPEVFREAFKCKVLYGSEIKVDSVSIDVQNITNKELKRTAVATVDLKLYNMASDSEVIEWTMVLPDLEITKFSPYLGATDKNDVSKTYSLENFIKGMFYGGVTNKTLKNNYILISKKS